MTHLDRIEKIQKQLGEINEGLLRLKQEREAIKREREQLKTDSELYRRYPGERSFGEKEQLTRRRKDLTDRSKAIALQQKVLAGRKKKLLAELRGAPQKLYRSELCLL